MRRTPADTPDVKLDLHGTGKHGFQDPNLPTNDGTVFDERMANSVQEEIARAIELRDDLDGSAADGSGETFTQLRTLLLKMRPNAVFGDNAVWRETSGISPSTGSGLTQTMSAGVVWINGQRVEFTAGLLALIGEDSHTYTASKDTYVEVHEDGAAAATPILYTETALGAGMPAPTAGYAIVAKVITDSSDVTGVVEIHADTIPVFAQALRHRPESAQHGEFVQEGSVGATATGTGLSGIKNFSQPDGVAGRLTIEVDAYNEAVLTDRYHRRLTRYVHWTGGSAVVAGPTVEDVEESSELPSGSATIAATGANVQIQVQADTGETWRFVVWYRLVTLGEQSP